MGGVGYGQLVLFFVIELRDEFFVGINSLHQICGPVGRFPAYGGKALARTGIHRQADFAAHTGIDGRLFAKLRRDGHALGRDGVMVTVLNGQDFRELDIPFKRHAARPAIGVGIGIDCAVRVFQPHRKPEGDGYRRLILAGDGADSLLLNSPAIVGRGDFLAETGTLHRLGVLPGGQRLTRSGPVQDGKLRFHAHRGRKVQRLPHAPLSIALDQQRNGDGAALAGSRAKLFCQL